MQNGTSRAACGGAHAADLIPASRPAPPSLATLAALVTAVCLAGCGGGGGSGTSSDNNSGAAPPPEPGKLACADVATLALTDTQIVEAGTVAASEAGPEHCLVRGVVGAYDGLELERVTYGNGFELRMPTDWNGRFLFQGSGAWGGVLNAATGGEIVNATGGVLALEQGYAVVTTDMGHQTTGVADPAQDARFGQEPRAREDWAYGSIEAVTSIAKEIVAAHYGEPEAYSYIFGCSNGGRQALISAQRLPALFDGVVAGAPEFDVTGSWIQHIWMQQAFDDIAWADGSQGRRYEAFSDANLRRLRDAVLAACDDDDELEDGLIVDPLACDFEPATLACSGAGGDGCLTSAQISGLQRIRDGAATSAGESLYEGGWSWGWEQDPGGVRRILLGTADEVAEAAQASSNWSRYLAFTPAEPDFQYLAFDFDVDPPRTAEAGALYNASATDYSEFVGRGGKVLIYHGTADPLFATAHLTQYFDELTAANGGAGATGDFARLFLVPGMTHCGGGRALDQFDALSAIVDWVENGVRPERIVARGDAFPARTRPLCPYPRQPRYDGSGSSEDAENFVCEDV